MSKKIEKHQQRAIVLTPKECSALNVFVLNAMPPTAAIEAAKDAMMGLIAGETVISLSEQDEVTLAEWLGQFAELPPEVAQVRAKLEA